MRIFKTTSVYDKDTNEWLEVYFINDQEVDEETYFAELDAEPIEDKEDNCGECINCMLDEYVARLQEVYPCPNCMRQVLMDFFLEITDEE